MPLSSSNVGGASYPGLGMPVSQYGWGPNGQPAMGPYSFLPGASNSYNTPTRMQSGNVSLNDQEYGPGHAGTSTGNSNASASAGPSTNATNFYDSVLNGTKLPYDATATSNMYSQAADMAGASETSRNSAMEGGAAAGGASASDPSLNSARNQSMATRQGQESQAKQGIDSMANQANFSAQMGAAAGENQYNLAQQGLGIEQQRLNQGMLGNMFGGGGGGGGGTSIQGLIRQLTNGNSNGGNQGFIGFSPEDTTSYNGTLNSGWGSGNAPYYQDPNNPYGQFNGE